MGQIEKRKLQLRDAAAVKAEVLRLRGGWRQVGNWSLEQICWHLHMGMTYAMSPGPHAAVTADAAAREKLARILASGEIFGVVAPERMVPPAVVGAEAIGEFLATLERFGAYAGPFPPHRVFGAISGAEYERLQYIHCSHHLGHLVPTGA